ncbi:conserved hypothetical protein [Methylocella silvestris BL2]|uniref:Aldehyde dehydrogenase n=1 Tax=Methylocella silvestris (strain DSM 15510 / CIP 108128 / LMG 27833 / NCIMB 13906 / BL2) TaxID=395965 RepID=B8EM33_METSB|nr:hypothetical protein [Methylocella silvestris]ACK51422.1 conserved hypothetical protein [Methylocella silvestris BL2]
MAQMIVVDEVNQDDMSRKAGCYLYCDTQFWLEDNAPHRADGPAMLSPDGVERWYLRGKEVTREVKAFFAENRWPLAQGLDTPEKKTLFAARFVD